MVAESKDLGMLLYAGIVVAGVIIAGIFYTIGSIDLTIIILLVIALSIYPILKFLSTIAFFKKTEIKLLNKTGTELWTIIVKQLNDGKKYLGYNSRLKIPKNYMPTHYELLKTIGFWLAEISREDLIQYEDFNYALLPHQSYTAVLDLTTGKAFIKEGFNLEDTEKWLREKQDLLKETSKALLTPTKIRETFFPTTE